MSILQQKLKRTGGSTKRLWKQIKQERCQIEAKGLGLHDLHQKNY